MVTVEVAAMVEAAIGFRRDSVPPAMDSGAVPEPSDPEKPGNDG